MFVLLLLLRLIITICLTFQFERIFALFPPSALFSRSQLICVCCGQQQLIDFFLDNFSCCLLLQQQEQHLPFTYLQKKKQTTAAINKFTFKLQRCMCIKCVWAPVGGQWGCHRTVVAVLLRMSVHTLFVFAFHIKMNAPKEKTLQFEILFIGQRKRGRV